MPTVLVVEDDAGLRDALRAIFDTGRCHVFWASDGDEAVGVLRCMQVHLIVLDRRVDGAALLARCAADPRLAAIPVATVSTPLDAARLAAEAARALGAAFESL